jgi:hypothetical protein
MNRQFQRRTESFTCANCGEPVAGSGYTNHCPHCLWSCHVDLNPGDRAADCGGMMAPVAVEPGRKGYIITHKCRRCGFEGRNRTVEADNFDAILAISRKRQLPR